MKVLIIGGAGYIGSHIAQAFIDNQHSVFIIDDLSTGHKSLIPPEAVFIEGDMGEYYFTKHIVQIFNIDTVIITAACSDVCESMYYPEKYYENNIIKLSICLRQLLFNTSVKKILFASSASAIDATHHYGISKRVMENLLMEYGVACNKSVIAFRIFNAAGADPNLRQGELHNPETHLIPNAIRAALTGNQLMVRGDSVRDYIHVCDIAQAFVDGAYFKKGCFIFGVGTGQGTRTSEIIKLVEEVTGEEIKKENIEKRKFEPGCLVFGGSKIFPIRVTFTNEEIIKTAMEWEIERNN